MPILEIKAPYPPTPGLLTDVMSTVAAALDIDSSRVSIFWDVVPAERYQHGSWTQIEAGETAAPVVLFNCRETHVTSSVRQTIVLLKDLLESRLACRKDTFIAVRRIRNDEVHAYGKLWG